MRPRPARTWSRAPVVEARSGIRSTDALAISTGVATTTCRSLSSPECSRASEEVDEGLVCSLGFGANEGETSTTTRSPVGVQQAFEAARARIRAIFAVGPWNTRSLNSTGTLLLRSAPRRGTSRCRAASASATPARVSGKASDATAAHRLALPVSVAEAFGRVTLPLYAWAARCGNRRYRGRRPACARALSGPELAAAARAAASSAAELSAS